MGIKLFATFTLVNVEHCRKLLTSRKSFEILGGGYDILIDTISGQIVYC